MWRIVAELVATISGAAVSGVAVANKEYLRVQVPPTYERQFIIDAATLDHRNSADESADEAWPAKALKSGGVQSIAAQIRAELGPTRPGSLMKPESIMYRTLATVMAARIFDDRTWYIQSIGDAKAFQLENRWLPSGQLPAALEQSPGPRDGRVAWQLIAGDITLAVFAAGLALTRAGEQLDLAKLFAAGGSFGDLASRVSHRHPRPANSVTVPNAKAPDTELDEFALTFNGYERWSSEPAVLGSLVQPVLNAVRRHGELTPFKLDALRAAAFYAQRDSRFTGDEAMRNQMLTIIDEIRLRYGPRVPGTSHLET